MRPTPAPTGPFPTPTRAEGAPDRPPAHGLLRHRVEDGVSLPYLLWAPGPGWRMISSGPHGGGLGERHWFLNAQVPSGYSRTDPEAHLAEIAAHAGLTGPGAGLMTAAEVAAHGRHTDEGVTAVVTAGVGVHGWAAAPTPPEPPEHPVGTVNILVVLPVPLAPAAFVGAVVTATEAKTQALLDVGVPGSGTPTDAVCVAAPAAGCAGGPATEPFAGPRSRWGARLARAVYAATREACRRDPWVRDTAPDRARPGA
ncbi:adenosylcobinamide amidohydrolase (plasmid) [Streptomyces sp. BI20]|uniref:adenosylcobinamide amidohydrolase n=1 Tax=Streptomyces sp. BI20 TaxID=3403460 RepID=UPI003C74D4E0